MIRPRRTQAARTAAGKNVEADGERATRSSLADVFARKTPSADTGEGVLTSTAFSAEGHREHDNREWISWLKSDATEVALASALAFPGHAPQWRYENLLLLYSGGTAPDSHRLPHFAIAIQFSQATAP
jgi:hypothetical protein